jgi:transcription initiation factor TFIIE subunit alpha
MRFTKKLAERVFSDIIGDLGVKLVAMLYGKKDVSELTIARVKFKKDINITRNLLYQLYNEHLVTFIKKKDKRRGWYVYYWTLNSERVKEVALKLNIEKKRALEQRLHREESEVFYTCTNGCTRLNFDKAVDFNFKCPVCGSLLSEEDNTKKIITLKKEIEKIESKISV